ncbi:hypothetical protein EYF80_034632 [Liparis tanakae]|uniref:Uncharacterized protein n=1 Tax=Liparis tanakae TaxID=230148 RepID=A0A4Z2GNQ6_9TELE|nr:hypothetical protein EYF80_034632 [Liparis tanakae]
MWNKEADVLRRSYRDPSPEANGAAVKKTRLEKGSQKGLHLSLLSVAWNEPPEEIDASKTMRDEK